MSDSFELPDLGSWELLEGGGGFELVIPLMIAEPNGMEAFFEPFLNVSLSPLPPFCWNATNNLIKNTLHLFHQSLSTINFSAAYSLLSSAYELGFQVHAEHLTVAAT